jgi:hypothetical protein
MRVSVLIVGLRRQLVYVGRGGARGYNGTSLVCWHSVAIRVGK